MRSSLSFRSPARPASTFGKLGASLFFLVFLAFGLGFSGLMLNEVFRYFTMRSWPAVTCRIESNDVNREKENYEPKIKYTYEIAGTKHAGTVIRRNYKGSDGYADAQKIAAKYAAGSTQKCYVNPSKPDDAILELEFPWPIFFIILPLIFVAIGGGGIYFTWKRQQEPDKLTAEPESITQAGQKGKNAGFVICLIFFVVGLVMLYFLTIRPGLRIMLAQGWQRVPCKIISSEVQTHRGSESTTYSVDILYEYTIGKETHRSDRYDFFGGSSSGYSSKRAIVQNYPVGSSDHCFVNPADPKDAVLVRDLTGHAWIGLFPIPFVLVGAIGMFLVRRQSRKKLEPLSPISPTPPRSIVTGYGPSIIKNMEKSGPVTLKSEQSTWKAVIILLTFTAAWNGFIWGLPVAQAIRSWRTSSPDWFLSIFMIPFVLVGIGMIFFTFYMFLKVFNPRISVTLSRSYLALGDSANIDWTFSGRFDRIERLTISLEAREEVTYRRGTDTHTDKHVFLSQDLFTTTKQVEIARSSTKFTIPADSMHSVSAANNHIIWCLHVRGAIAKWPDVQEEFRLNVQPKVAHT